MIFVLLLGLVLVASIVWVAAAASVKEYSSPGVVAITVPFAPAVAVQVEPVVTATTAPSSVVIAVPVATPPSQ